MKLFFCLGHLLSNRFLTYKDYPKNELFGALKKLCARQNMKIIHCKTYRICEKAPTQFHFLLFVAKCPQKPAAFLGYFQIDGKLVASDIDF